MLLTEKKRIEKRLRLDTYLCPRCQGSGHVMVLGPEFPEFKFTAGHQSSNIGFSVPCSVCKGTGRIRK